MKADPNTFEGSRALSLAQARSDGWFGSAIRPGAMVAVLVTAQVLIWGVLTAHFDLAPPTDSLEQVLLSQDLRLFYEKHPALPTWILYAVNQVVGLSISSTFVLGALCSALTLLLHYAWARRQVGAERAALATLLASTIVFMNAGAIQYSNNTAQLPLALLCIVVFHIAISRGGPLAWSLLGVSAALMALAKLSAVVLFASFAVYLVWTGRLRQRSTWFGVAVAAAVFVALVAPILIASTSVDPDADAYMRMMVFPPEVGRIGRLLSVWDFSVAQLAALAPALLLFIVLRRGAPSTPPENAGAIPLAPFLTIVGFAPFVLTVAVALLTGARLLSGWGTTFYVLLPLWLVAAQRFSVDASRAALARAAVLCLCMHAVLWTALIINGGALPSLNSNAHRHGALATGELARAVRRAWAARTTSPLRYVVADIRTGAAMAVAFGGEPRVIDGNRPDFARTLPRDVQMRCGFVVAAMRPARARSSPRHDPLDDLLTAAPLEPVMLQRSDGSLSVYFIGVSPPVAGMQCTAGD